MSNRLLQRQIRLLEYLTSVDAIFEDRGIPPAANGLEGLDPGRLALEARFSFEKRLEKISAVFPRTFAVRSSDWAPILEKFVEEHPPSDIGRFENVHQFFEFLSEREIGNLERPWLLDLAACELACARVRRHRDVPGSTRNHAPTPAMRRVPGIAILRCGHMFARFSKMRREVALWSGVRRCSPSLLRRRPSAWQYLKSAAWCSTCFRRAKSGPILPRSPPRPDMKRSSKTSQDAVCWSCDREDRRYRQISPIQGGVSMRTYWNAHRLAAQGHEVHVMTNAKEVSAPYSASMWYRPTRS
jgi:hypothetical protein